MLMRRPRMTGAKRAIREGGSGEVHVAYGITGGIKLPCLVDPVVHLISAEHRMGTCCLRMRAPDPRRQTALPLLDGQVLADEHPTGTRGTPWSGIPWLPHPAAQPTGCRLSRGCIPGR